MRRILQKDRGESNESWGIRIRVMAAAEETRVCPPSSLSAFRVKPTLEAGFARHGRLIRSIRFHEHFIHGKWVIEVAFAYEGHGMASPLAHGAGGDNARGPEDEAL